MCSLLAAWNKATGGGEIFDERFHSEVSQGRQSVSHK